LILGIPAMKAIFEASGLPRENQLPTHRKSCYLIQNRAANGIQIAYLKKECGRLIESKRAREPLPKKTVYQLWLRGKAAASTGINDLRRIR
jgi:hypothetical protein